MPEKRRERKTLVPKLVSQETQIIPKGRIYAMSGKYPKGAKVAKSAKLARTGRFPKTAKVAKSVKLARTGRFPKTARFARRAITVS